MPRHIASFTLFGLLLVTAGCGAKVGTSSGKSEVLGKWVIDVDATMKEFPSNPMAAAYSGATPDQQQSMRELAAAKVFMEFFDDGRVLMAIKKDGTSDMMGTWRWDGSGYAVTLDKQEGQNARFIFRDGKVSGGDREDTKMVFAQFAEPAP